MDAQANNTSISDFEDYFNFGGFTSAEEEVKVHSLEARLEANTVSQKTMSESIQQVSADTSSATTPDANTQESAVINDPEQQELQESNLPELDPTLAIELFDWEEEETAQEQEDSEFEDLWELAFSKAESEEEEAVKEPSANTFVRPAHGLTLPTMVTSNAPVVEQEQPYTKNIPRTTIQSPPHGLTLPKGVPVIDSFASASQQVFDGAQLPPMVAIVDSQAQPNIPTPVIDLINDNFDDAASITTRLAKTSNKRARSQDSTEDRPPKTTRQASASPVEAHVFAPRRPGCLYMYPARATLIQIPAGRVFMCRCQWRRSNSDMSEPCEPRSVRKECVSPSVLRIDTNVAPASQFMEISSIGIAPQQTFAFPQQMGQPQNLQMAMPKTNDNFRCQPSCEPMMSNGVNMQPQQYQLAMQNNVLQYPNQFPKFECHNNNMALQSFQQQHQQTNMAQQMQRPAFLTACQNIHNKYPNMAAAQVTATVQQYVRVQQQRQCQQQQVSQMQQTPQGQMQQRFPQQAMGMPRNVLQQEGQQQSQYANSC